MRKLSHTDRYKHGERSMLVFISTVMNMENGRCGMTFSMLLPDFLKGFAQWFALFCAVVLLYMAFCINGLTLLW